MAETITYALATFITLCVLSALVIALLWVRQKRTTITTASFGGFQKGDAVLVNGESFRVTAVSSPTQFTVRKGFWDWIRG